MGVTTLSSSGLCVSAVEPGEAGCSQLGAGGVSDGTAGGCRASWQGQQNCVHSRPSGGQGPAQGAEAKLNRNQCVILRACLVTQWVLAHAHTAALPRLLNHRVPSAI
jgi:hypothetical protein